MSEKGKRKAAKEKIGAAELKRVEKELRKSEERYRTLTENVNVGIYRNTPGPKGIFIEANPAIVKMFGYKSREELLSINVADLYQNPKDRKKFNEEILREGFVKDEELQLKKKDGTPIIGSVSAVAVKDEKGKVQYYDGIFDDITERKRAEKMLRKAYNELEEKVAERTKELTQANIRLQELDRLKSMFIASMSHELRTPLNSIIGFTGIILQGMAGEITEEQREQLTMVKNSANHLLSLVIDVIDLSSIEAGKIKILIKETDVAKTVDEVLTTFANDIRKKGLALKKNIPEKLIISTDEKRFKQILINLLGNAVKFTDKGSIEVGCKVDEEEIEISVKDTGVGIREAGMKKLFKPFAQVDSELKVKYGGPGLGLYSSKRIVELLGGKIWVESEFGKGSKFAFVLPIKKEVKT